MDEPLARTDLDVSLWRLLAELANVFFVLDPSMRIVDASDRTVDALGYSRDELLAMPPGALLTDATAPFTPELRARMGQGEAVRSSRQVRCKDGSTRWFEFASREIPHGHVVAVGLDVDEQRRASDRLRRSEESFRALIENSPELILIHRAGEVVYCNPSALTHFGFTRPEQVLGRSAVSFMHPDDREIAVARIKALSAGTAFVPPQEERFVHVDGSILYVEVTAMRTMFQGEPAVVAIGRDVTERRQLQARFAHNERVASVGRLAAGVAHEVNNPLTFVTLNVGAVAASLAAMVRAQTAPDRATLEGLSEAIRTASEGLDRVRRIVRDLKTFARQDDDRESLVDLHETVESALSLAAHELRLRARVTRDFHPVGAVRGIEGRLCQVFLNLLVNAAQAGPLDEHAPPHEVRVRITPDGDDMARVEVIDAGRGIPTAVRARLFEPFFTTKPDGEGTGLGLAISADIVRAHRGSISVDSEEGRGTTVTVRLPVEPSAPSEAPARAPSSPAPASRLLVVDDEPHVLASVARALADRHAVVTVGSAAAAILAIERDGPFDMVLCDVVMPEMGGVELLQVIAARWPDLAPRVLLMTGGSSGQEGLRAVGEARVLQKPFDVAALRSRVDDVLSEE